MNPLDIYKETEYRHLTTKEITHRLLLTIRADAKDINSGINQEPTALHAMQSLFMLSEHLNPQLPEEEYISLHNILWKLNSEFNKIVTRQAEILPKAVEDSLSFLIDSVAGRN